jgi:ABC-2 type transport system ATP-binding protein
MTAPVLEVRGLSKRFGSRTAVDGLSFAVEKGEVFGILGPNGAGKTTTFHLLVGLLAPDAGEIWMDGAPASPTEASTRERLGVVFQQPSLDDKLSGRENLLFGAALYGLGGREAQRRADAMLDLVELTDRAREPASRYSGGMKRRIEIGRVLLARPEVLVMDEPSRGVDLASQRRIWAQLDEERRTRGLSIILSTHSPEEAERCDRVAVIDEGKLLVIGTPDELRARVGGDVVRIAADRPEEIAAGLTERLGLSARVIGEEVVVTSAEAHTIIPRIVEAFPAGRLRSVSLRRPDLADVFIALTGRELAEKEDGAPAPPPKKKRARSAGQTAVVEPHPPPAAGGPARSGSAHAGPTRIARSFFLATLGVLVRRELVRFFRQKSRVVGALGQPIIFWLVIGGGLAGSFRMPGAELDYRQYFYPGVIVMIVLFTSIFTTLSVIEDRHAGFLQAVLVAPAPRLALVLGKVLGGVAVALVQAALFLALAPIAGFSFADVHLPLCAANLLLTSLAFTALGFTLAWWLDSVQGYHAIMSVLLIPLWVLSGAMFPAAGASPVLAAIMRGNPMSYSVDAMRLGLHGPAAFPASSAPLDLAVIGAFAAITLFAAAWACNRRA